MNVLQNIQEVQRVFKSAQQLALKSSFNDDLFEQLNALSNEFRSVAYEGASFSIALNSISTKGNLDIWKQYLVQTKGLHDSQIHVGLGWALASQNSNIEEHILNIDPYMVSRVIDGYGYYFAIFKRRIAIRTAQIPESISDVNKMAFDQGVGRSLWYLSEGNLEKLKRFLLLIPANRHADLWRGIGIAFAYVGGTSEVSHIEKLSDKHLIDFKTGVALALHSRMKSGSILESSTIIGEKSFNNLDQTLDKISNFNVSDLYSTSILDLQQVF